MTNPGSAKMPMCSTKSTESWASAYNHSKRCSLRNVRISEASRTLRGHTASPICNSVLCPSSFACICSCSYAAIDVRSVVPRCTGVAVPISAPLGALHVPLHMTRGWARFYGSLAETHLVLVPSTTIARLSHPPPHHSPLLLTLTTTPPLLPTSAPPPLAKRTTMSFSEAHHREEPKRTHWPGLSSSSSSSSKGGR